MRSNVFPACALKTDAVLLGQHDRIFHDGLDLLVVVLHPIGRMGDAVDQVLNDLLRVFDFGGFVCRLNGSDVVLLEVVADGKIAPRRRGGGIGFGRRLQ